MYAEAEAEPTLSQISRAGMQQLSQGYKCVISCDLPNNFLSN